MLNLINILTLSTALTLQPLTQNITLSITQDNTTTIIAKSNLQKEEKYNYAFIFLLLNDNKNMIGSVAFENYNTTNTHATSFMKEAKYIGIGYTNQNNVDIEKYSQFNEIKQTSTYYLYINTTPKYNGTNTYTITINIRSNTFMEELLTALTTAVQSAVSIFVEGFGGLTQIFYNGTEITFIGGILIVGLAVMFLMMFLRWIISFVKGI